jgi:hypothetical protein
MNKKKFLMSTGAVVLGLVGVLVGRASAKFATAPNLYYTTAGTTASCHLLKASPSISQFTTGGSLETQAKIVTQANGTSRAIFANSGCTVAVHFRP